MGDKGEMKLRGGQGFGTLGRNFDYQNSGNPWASQGGRSDLII